MILWRSDSGVATAEFALVIPSFVVLLLVLLGSFQLGMERINNQQAAQAEAIKVGLGGETDFEQMRQEGMVCISINGYLEILNAYACAADYRFSRLDISDDVGLELFGN